MDEKIILLVEDNPDDEMLTLRALQKNNIRNAVVVARDGVEALDYLFGTGTYAGRNLSIMPQVVLLDLKLPKLDGLGVLRRVRADEIWAKACKSIWHDVPAPLASRPPIGQRICLTLDEAARTTGRPESAILDAIAATSPGQLQRVGV